MKTNEPIAFDDAQITSKSNRTKVEPGLPASTISKQSRMHVAVGIDGSETGFALRAEPSHSGDKGDGGVNTNMVVESYAVQEDNQNGVLLSKTAGSLRSDAPGSQPCGTLALVAHSLKAEGFDASEDGTGRGVPLVPEIVGALSDGAHMGGGLTDRTRIREESLPCVSSKWSKGTGGPAGDECQNLVVANGGFFSDAIDSNSQVGITRDYANAIKADTVEVLFSLHSEIGEEAFTEWGFGVLAAFFPAEVLQQALHGTGIRCATVEEFGLVNYALSCAEVGAARAVCYLQQIQGSRCASFGWQPHEQRSIKLAAYLSRVSCESASCESFMRDLWCTSKGPGVLREALSKIQEVRRPTSLETKPAQSTYAVRRLTAAECEILQGFPRNFTLVEFNGKPACDGPRYKAIGNSMAVPNIEWILRRMDLVDELTPLPEPSGK